MAQPNHTAHDLARIALNSTGTNPDRRYRLGDAGYACRFVATQALEELESLSTEDLRLLWETIMVITDPSKEA